MLYENKSFMICNYGRMGPFRSRSFAKRMHMMRREGISTYFEMKIGKIYDNSSKTMSLAKRRLMVVGGKISVRYKQALTSIVSQGRDCQLV